MTVDANFSIAQALAIKDGKLIAVGTNDDALSLRGPNTRVVDLAGKTVIPGLQDSHIHFLSLGEEQTYEADLTYARNAQDIVRAIAELKQRRNPPAGEWLRGTKWDQYKYPEMVTRWQLDAVSPLNPVRLDRTYRGVAVNSEVFRRMGINDEKPDTWPAWWLKDPGEFTFEDKIFREKRRLSLDTGEVREVEVPTGVFLGSRAGALVRTANTAYTFDQDVESIKSGSQEMLRLGVTSVVDPSSRMGYNMRVYQEAYNRGWLTVRISAVYEGTFNTQTPDAIRQRLDAIKINNLGNSFLDGAARSSMATAASDRAARGCPSLSITRWNWRAAPTSALRSSEIMRHARRSTGPRLLTAGISTPTPAAIRRCARWSTCI